MSLTTCRDCGKPVSPTAYRCNRCGARKPGWRLWHSFVPLVALLIFFAYVVEWAVTHPSTTPPTASVTEAQPERAADAQPVDTPAPDTQTDDAHVAPFDGAARGDETGTDAAGDQTSAN